MAKAAPMKKIWEARRLISNHGYSVAQAAKTTGLTEATVRNYTKAERAQAKVQQAMAR